MVIDPTPSRRWVQLVALGGTIAMGDATREGVEVSFGAHDLLVRQPELADLAEIRGQTLRSVDSSQLDLEAIDEVVAAIALARREGAAGVVITQGTDSLEEVAFALDLLVDTSEIAVIVTGAMRNPTMSGNDGPANLRHGICAALAPEMRGVGVCVVMNDEIHAARFVSKVHATNPATFRSYPGPIGWVLEDRVTVAARPIVQPTIDPIVRTDQHRVGLITTHLGDQGDLVEAMLEAGFDGIVVEAFGSGRVTVQSAIRLLKASEAIPVVVSSRAGTGEMSRATYSGEGTLVHLMRHGILSSGWLPGLKARMLLELLIREGADRQEIARQLSFYSG